MRHHSERGQLSVFVVLLALPLVAMAGLLADGGGVLAAHQQAVANAFEAARAGAQAIDISALRSSEAVILEQGEARAQAIAYLSAVGENGTVSVQGDSVTVMVSLRHSLAVLSVFGLGPVTVTGTATATAVQGIVGADQ